MMTHTHRPLAGSEFIAPLGHRNGRGLRHEAMFTRHAKCYSCGQTIQRIEATPTRMEYWRLSQWGRR